MGAWRYILSHLKNLNIKLVSRKPSPAPASGSSKSFADQQKIIIDSIFK
jgi:2-oxoglutarate dehydrogenase complex dehydrogenase (E1) component-like enzyme